MIRKLVTVVCMATLAVALSACRTNKHVTNPIANVSSKQPDKVLFDRAMDAMKHNKYDVARLTLQTLINAYPDSEYVARAKLAIGDSWYAEGGSAALVQAESEYHDFQTFFPNMPEAAEAQLKIADIHFKQMEKPDRDFTHAKRAEDEYRQLILQYPDSKLVPQAKQKLLAVQEVLAEREYRIGRFYYMREAYPAAEARLKTLIDTYPLYSQADEVLYLLGQTYERQVGVIRAMKGASETDKGRLIKHLNDEAAEAYSRIITRYPLMDRADDAKKRLAEMHRPLPRPTPEAIAQNKREQESRSSASMFAKMMENFRKGPDMAEAVKRGEPTLVDPKPTNAPELIKQATATMNSKGGDNKVSLEAVKEGAPPPNQPVPRSDATTTLGAPTGNAGPPASDPNAPSDNNGIPELQPVGAGSGAPDANNAAPSTAAAQPPAQGLVGTQPAANGGGTDSVQELPTQANEVDNGSSSSSSSSSSNANASTSSASSNADPADESSSVKKKKKKGMHKLNPF